MCALTDSFERKIKDAFYKKLPGVDVFVYDEIGSTNTEAKKYAVGCKSKIPTFFIARAQSAGRGRLGRSFLSKEGGLYMSYLDYPGLNVNDAVRLTAFAAVALSKTVTEFTGLKPEIKWVNDCFVGNKKLAGILTEGEFDEDGSGFKYTVTGVGVNLARVDFGDVSDIATDIESECGKVPDLAEFAVSLAKKLVCFEEADACGYMEEYCALSMLPGRKIKVTTPLDSYFAVAKRVEKDGSLTVVTESGETVNLISGDVSIKFD